jgi:hypothetical protein
LAPHRHGETAGTRDEETSVELSYVVPVRHGRGEDFSDLAAYLNALAASGAEVIVVDGSDAPVRRAHADQLAAAIVHIRPDPAPRFANGKVDGVWTGVRRSANEAVVIADDDVRYDRAGLDAACALLGSADLVCPQNHFRPLPWHAAWDSGRTVLNRALGGDYPGTLVIRRSRFMSMGGYEGDVLFENLDLMRTVAADGGVVVRAPSLFVARRPPTARHFVGQRVRQAYDDLAMPARFVAGLAVLPAMIWLARRAGAAGPALAAALVVALAERGRRRDRGRDVFPPVCALAAPLWVAERGVCAWIALWHRVRHGGIHYAGGHIRRAASGPARARRRQALRAARCPGRTGFPARAARPTPTGARRPRARESASPCGSRRRMAG